MNISYLPEHLNTWIPEYLIKNSPVSKPAIANHKPPLSFLVLTIFLLTACTILPVSVLAGDEPFTYTSNWGGTGLMEIPTARVMKKHSYRMGIGQVDPYRYYYGAISPFQGIEIDGRITEFLDTDFAEQKTSKDKAIDFKLQFYREGKYMPALALGIMDPHGTRIFASQYIVASKQIFPFDFTLGFGNGRFGKRPLISRTENFRVEMFTDTIDWFRDSQFFWGIQFVPSDKLALMLEYSPIKFHKQTTDPERNIEFKEPVPSNYNFGIRFKPTDWTEITLSYQRGNQFGAQLATVFDIGNPLVPIFDIPYWESTLDSRRPIEKRLIMAIYKSGFSDIGVTFRDQELWIEAQNEKYFYNTRAIGVILENLARIKLPDEVRRLHIILKENSIPVIRFSTDTINVYELFAEKLTFKEFMLLSELSTSASDKPRLKTSHVKKFNYRFRPVFESFLNDPAGFFKYRLGVAVRASYQPWAGGLLLGGMQSFPLNNVRTTNKPLSIPVRSDIVDYKDEDFVLSNLMFDQIVQLDSGLYGRIAAGLLEAQYAGIDAEIASPFYDGRLLLGLGGSIVKKRASEDPFKLKQDPVKDAFTTGFFNARINVPEFQSSLDIKAGRFLAGDNGVQFTVSKFIKGVTVWAWYSFTDTSVFDDKFNKGYHDKGIGVSIPLRLFKGTDSRTAYIFTLSPWTRDTGQDIDHARTLFGFMNRNLKIYLDKDVSKMYK